MINENEATNQDDWNDRQNNDFGNIPLATPSDGHNKSHYRHPAMSFVEFIDYRFMRKL